MRVDFCFDVLVEMIIEKLRFLDKYRVRDSGMYIVDRDKLRL